MNGGEARLSRRPFPIITGWGEVVPPVASVLRAHHAVLMHSESRRRRQGVGPARADAVGRPQSPALPPLLLEERGGRGPTPLLYKEREGATEIRTPSPSSFCFWFPSPICDGGGEPWFFFGPASSSCRGLDLLGRPEWRGWGRGRGWRQGRCLIFQLCLRRLRLLQPPETPGRSPRIFSWCLLPPVAHLGAPFALFAYLPYLLRR